MKADVVPAEIQIILTMAEVTELLGFYNRDNSPTPVVLDGILVALRALRGLSGRPGI